MSRNVVIQVYEQLCAEGWLSSRVGDGTYANEGLRRDAPSQALPTFPHETSPSFNVIDFDMASGLVDVSRFPRQIWARCQENALRHIIQEGAGYPDIRGDQRLLEALCAWLYRSRGISTSPARIVVTGGTSESCAISAMALHTPQCKIIVEDPCLDSLRTVFQSAGWTLVPQPVTEDGIDVPAASADLLLLNPSHQFPTGTVLPMKKRIALLDWAKRSQCYILEDDYDSEYRYVGAPIAPMHSCDPERVIYLGTFSKFLFPGLRIGFAVLPAALHERFCLARSQLGLYCSSLLQRSLALFLESGQLDRHVTATRKLYKKKRAYLISCLKESFGDGLRISGDAAGLFLAADFSELEPRPDWRLSQDNLVRVGLFRHYALGGIAHPERAVLGFGNLTEQRISQGVRRIKALCVAGE